KVVERLVIDREVAAARTEKDPRRRGLASPSPIVRGSRCHVSNACQYSLERQISSGFGCCAVCGCSAPANTCSFLNILRPSGFFGSIPLTAYSINRKSTRLNSSHV